jgi:hypothetical protein
MLRAVTLIGGNAVSPKIRNASAPFLSTLATLTVILSRSYPMIMLVALFDRCRISWSGHPGKVSDVVCRSERRLSN